jgi:hypothetical protein
VGLRLRCGRFAQTEAGQRFSVAAKCLALNGQNIPMNGLYDGDFVGYKIASPTELDAALREAVVAVDASVLLDLICTGSGPGLRGT